MLEVWSCRLDKNTISTSGMSEQVCTVRAGSSRRVRRKMDIWIQPLSMVYTLWLQFFNHAGVHHSSVQPSSRGVCDESLNIHGLHTKALHKWWSTSKPHRQGQNQNTHTHTPCGHYVWVDWLSKCLLFLQPLLEGLSCSLMQKTTGWNSFLLFYDVENLIWKRWGASFTVFDYVL